MQFLEFFKRAEKRTSLSARPFYCTFLQHWPLSFCFHEKCICKLCTIYLRAIFTQAGSIVAKAFRYKIAVHLQIFALFSQEQTNLEYCNLLLHAWLEKVATELICAVTSCRTSPFSCTDWLTFVKFKTPYIAHIYFHHQLVAIFWEQRC